MTWSAPMTAVSGATFTAAQFNQYVRDNLNSTAPALASAASQIFVSTGVNAIAARVPTSQSVVTIQSTTSTSFTDLTTVGPLISVVTGTIAIVLFASGISTATNDSTALVSVAVSGASSVAASDAWAIQMDGITAGNVVRYSGVHIFTGLTPGTNVFTLKYKAPAGVNATFRNREINVIPL